MRQVLKEEKREAAFVKAQEHRPERERLAGAVTGEVGHVEHSSGKKEEEVAAGAVVVWMTGQALWSPNDGHTTSQRNYLFWLAASQIPGRLRPFGRHYPGIAFWRAA
jgi:hypothetical protein